MSNDFFKLSLFLIICLVICLIIFLLSYFLVFQTPDIEKLTSYECGFEPFSDSRIPFEVKYYLVAILFIIFDLELIFLLPWTLVWDELNLWGDNIMIIFVFVLGLAFVYEWFKGALDW